jgi:hypothetical protein
MRFAHWPRGFVPPPWGWFFFLKRDSRVFNADAVQGENRLPDVWEYPSGAKAQLILLALSARLKSCPFKNQIMKLSSGDYSEVWIQ